MAAKASPQKRGTRILKLRTGGPWGPWSQEQVAAETRATGTGYTGSTIGRLERDGIGSERLEEAVIEAIDRLNAKGPVVNPRENPFQPHFEAIGQAIRAARGGRTQRSVAAAAGLSPSLLCLIESGTGRCSEEKIRKAAAAVEVDLSPFEPPSVVALSPPRVRSVSLARSTPHSDIRNVVETLERAKPKLHPGLWMIVIETVQQVTDREIERCTTFQENRAK